MRLNVTLYYIRTLPVLLISFFNTIVVVVLVVVGAYQHCSHEGLLYSNPSSGVLSLISRGSAHQEA
jgi:hypothetical protein